MTYLSEPQLKLSTTWLKSHHHEVKGFQNEYIYLICHVRKPCWYTNILPLIFFFFFFFKCENINLDCFLQRDLTKASKSNVKSGLLNSTVSHQWWFNGAALAQRFTHLRGSLLTQWTRGNFLQKTVNILSTFLFIRNYSMVSSAVCISLAFWNFYDVFIWSYFILA